MSSSLSFIAQQIVIYVSIPVFIAGTLGGFCNVIVFLSLRTFRESSCAFYLTVASVANIGQLITGSFTRIMITGFKIDWTQGSLFYCKFRPFMLYLTSLISSTCLCLATIDQYLATCSRPRWQQWSNIKLAHRLTLFFSIAWCLEQIPSLVFYDHIISPSTNRTICSPTNIHFVQYHNYFTVVTLWFIVPLSIFASFGILALRNVQQIAYRAVPLVRRELDKQLTVMVLVQVLVNFIVVIPNCIITFLNTSQSLQANAIIADRISFANSIVVTVFYLYFASPFYIYVCASERFRRQLIYVLSNIHYKRIQERMGIINVVAPVS